MLSTSGQWPVGCSSYGGDEGEGSGSVCLKDARLLVSLASVSLAMSETNTNDHPGDFCVCLLFSLAFCFLK